MHVYILEEGCRYEGGSVRGVYLSEETGKKHFNTLLEEYRSRNNDMYTWSIENDRGDERAKGWLEEEEYTSEEEHTFVFYSTDYVTLRRYTAI
jgi:hypothetical protein